MCKFGSNKEKEFKFRCLFLKHHKNADRLLFSLNSKEPLAAIYLTPEALHRKNLKKIARAIQEEFYYQFENEDE